MNRRRLFNLTVLTINKYNNLDDLRDSCGSDLEQASMSKQSNALISFGANLPSATASVGETLRTALHIVHKNQSTSITRLSKFWKTPAFPFGSGPDYLNGAMSLLTTLTPQQLLDTIHEIERLLGRSRDNGRWSARVLDLDLIAYDQIILPNHLTQNRWMELPLDQQRLETPDTLILPHPRMQDRGFVLVPLAEIAPNWVHPVTNRTVQQMLNALPASSLAEMTPYSLESLVVP